MIRLLCMTGELAGQRFEAEHQVTIGSHPDNEVSLPHGTISRRHARIYVDPDDECLYLEDLDSSNGTRLDGARVERPEKLGRLHVITLAGQHELIFQRL